MNRSKKLSSILDALSSRTDEELETIEEQLGYSGKVEGLIVRQDKSKPKFHFESEFPDFTLGFCDGYSEPIEIPSSWQETSWHNDVCPSWEVPGSPRIRVWVDYADSSMSECSAEEGGKYLRFRVNLYDAQGDDLTEVFATDSWAHTMWVVNAAATQGKNKQAVAVVGDPNTGRIKLETLTIPPGTELELWNVREILNLPDREAILSFGATVTK